MIGNRLREPPMAEWNRGFGDQHAPGCLRSFRASAARITTGKESDLRALRHMFVARWGAPESPARSSPAQSPSRKRGAGDPHSAVIARASGRPSTHRPMRARPIPQSPRPEVTGLPPSAVIARDGRATSLRCHRPRKRATQYTPALMGTTIAQLPRSEFTGLPAFAGNDERERLARQ